MVQEIPGTEKFRESVAEKCGGKALTIAESLAFKKKPHVQRCAIRFMRSGGSEFESDCVVEGSQEFMWRKKTGRSVENCPWVRRIGANRLIENNRWVLEQLHPEFFNVIYTPEPVKSDDVIVVVE